MHARRNLSSEEGLTLWAEVYGLDIETDTSELTTAERAAGHTSRGLDPRIGRITSVAIARESDVLVWEAETPGAEASMLTEVHQFFLTNASGLIVTWNGSVFDLPYLHDRYRHHHLEGHGPLITPNSRITPKYGPLPGHAGGYSASWRAGDHAAAHAHLDLAYYAHNSHSLEGSQWALKPFAREHGYSPVELNRDELHRYSAAEVRNYVASDASVTRSLALSLLPGINPNPDTKTQA